MKNSIKYEQNAPNLDTSAQFCENLLSQEEQNQVENLSNLDDVTKQNAQFDQKAQQSDEKDVNVSRNSTNYTCVYSGNCDFSQNVNSDTSKNIIDPLSVIDTQNSGKKALDSSVAENEKIVFSKLFPNVSLEKLEQDELFSLFSSHNGKNIAISELYTNYLRLINALEDDFVRKSAVSVQNKLSSPGSLDSSKKTSDVFFTKEQVLRMSAEQISKNYETISKSQQKW